MPRVSVIVPAHDAEAHVGEALSSIRSQTWGDWEAIVVDDASSDGTAELVRGVADPRIRLVESEENRGPAATRNLGVAEASGELVALLDADDRWLPNYLERQVGRYDDEERRRPGVGIVGCDAYVAMGERVATATYLTGLSRPVREVDVGRMLRGNAIFVSALVPYEAGQEAGWFDPDLFGTEDHDLWLRILETGRRAIVNHEPLAVYRMAAGSVSGDLGRMARNHQQTLQRALARGRLTARQRRIAQAELRYHRAMEVVARAALEDGGRSIALCELPLLAWVVVSRPGQWAGWWRALRAKGRVAPA